jgi:hypothetical protein
VSVKRIFSTLAIALLACLSTPGATLERLSMDDMIVKSTAIVRGKVVGARCAFHGPMIYTFSSVQVLERWKGLPASTVEVATPGGKANGMQQNFSGAPTLVEGSEYLIFLWTGKNGMTHIIGLSQGVFDLKRNAQGDLMAMRTASTEMMLDPVTKQPVTDANFTIRMQDITQQITRMLALAGVK